MNWQDFIKQERSLEYFNSIETFINNDVKTNKVFPPRSDLFNAFRLTPYENIKVLILGQDPYILPGQAHGLAFSVKDGIAIPSSLKNIYRELHSDLNIPPSKSGNLTSWAKQGVFLLNSMLTVREGQSGSHANIGWQTFTDKVISKVNDKDTPIVFILWGNFAKSKKVLITNPSHLILEGVHPSGLSANRGGFFGGRYFSKANDFLKANGIEGIDWTI